MTDSPDPALDPAAAVRAMLDQWLSLSKVVAERTQQAPGFDAMLGQAGTLSAAAQASFAETIGRVMSGMNLPNRAEVLAIDTAVVALGARLERIEAVLAALAGSMSSPTPTPTPTPTPSGTPAPQPARPRKAAKPVAP